MITLRSRVRVVLLAVAVAALALPASGGACVCPATAATKRSRISHFSTRVNGPLFNPALTQLAPTCSELDFCLLRRAGTKGAERH